MKAIETDYNGYLFRSRIEARWSIVFNTLRVPFEYEKEGYHLKSGMYLPDFWLPEQKYWVEIKGASPTAQERILAGELAEFTKSNVFIFFGAIPTEHSVTDSALAFFPEGGEDNLYMLCECLDCGMIDIQFDGRSDRMACKSNGCRKSSHGDKGYTNDTERILKAYDIARKARFEHGAAIKTEEESPRKIEYVPRKKQTSDFYKWMMKHQAEKNQ